MNKPRGSIGAIKKIVEFGNRISIEEMASISDMANSLGGGLVSVDPDDDWCGNGRIRIPWPPKQSERFIKMLDTLADRWINYEVLINGIPVPDYIVINVSRQIGR